MFLSFLKNYELNPELFEPFKIQFQNYCEHAWKDDFERTKSIQQKIKIHEDELYLLKKNYTLGKIKESEEFYNQLKAELEKQIVDLRMAAGHASEKLSNLDSLVTKSLAFLSNLPDSWVSGDIKAKMEMQEILFPEGIMYDHKNRHYLTKKTNEYLEHVHSFSKDYEEMGEKKRESFPINSENSPSVAGTRFELVTFGL